MNILVTGGCGFIGSHVVRVLEKDHKVLIVDNLSSGKPSSTLSQLVKLDITNQPELERVFLDFKPEIVVHLAAQVQLRKSLDEPIFDATQNVLGTIAVLEASRKSNIKKFIYSSTGGARYGEPTTLPVNEEYAPDPLSPYGISKHSAEHYVSAYSRLYGFDHLILCFGNVYGPGDDPSQKRVISVFTTALLRNESPRIFGDGGQTRDFLYVEDIALVIKQSLTKKTTHTLFNLGSGEKTSVIELYTMIEQELKTGIQPTKIEAIKGELRDIVLDITRVQDEFGFKPTRIEEGIKKTVAWFRDTYDVSLAQKRT